MKRLITTIAFVMILSSCTGTVTQAPVSGPTAGLEAVVITLPTETPLPTATMEMPTAIVAPSATEEVLNMRTSSVDGMPQVYIPAGTIHMGGFDVRAAPDEFPAHEVMLDAFWMDQLEVTNAMYQLCAGAGVCTPPQSFESNRRTEYYNNPEFKDYPVVYISWGQAKAYCEWAGRKLPTEAEWERAARGDDMRTFPWGEDKPDYRLANFNMLVTDTSRVGSYPLGASPFGVLDMAGNVAEWTNDLYKSNYYALSDLINPTGPPAGSTLFHVVRGGSLGDAEINIRVSKRSSVLGSDLRAKIGSPEYLGDFSPRIGFRCAGDE